MILIRWNLPNQNQKFLLDLELKINKRDGGERVHALSLIASVNIGKFASVSCVINFWINISSSNDSTPSSSIYSIDENG